MRRSATLAALIVWLLSASPSIAQSPDTSEPDGVAPLLERLEQIEVSVVQGSDRNIKITKPTDMDLAQLFLSQEMAADSA